MSPPRKMISFRISKLPIITVIFPWLTDFHPFSLSGHWRTPGWSNNGRYNHTWSENRSWVACRGDERRTWWPTLDGESQERRRTSGSYRANRIGRDRRTELWQKQYCVNTSLEIQGSNVIFPLGAMHTQLCADSNQETRGCFSIKMPSYPYRNSRYKDNTVVRLSYLYNGNPIGSLHIEKCSWWRTSSHFVCPKFIEIKRSVFLLNSCQAVQILHTCLSMWGFPHWTDSSTTAIKSSEGFLPMEKY